ncbi:shikimate dehydrogenase [Clostridium beijerinckii]|uniref:Shikimate dehydrogenase (NADP(+)) n=1 Tax=Clostridium beijerinckii TaxID=1520 RepID=A0AAW3W5A7_CLOBE|nr:shikimate dehydrogenase [Clostridium beijerinckii]MBC2456282.1 shikimate dehydrogenase [Clostridium beijerinckii]MBC2474114.1 shikimate dehydrogenase [Clostridium beijerinckii]NOV62087.1 shikimate dehydrogenase [Clostridium beijerinckii]NOV68417.1 shikimate dehydrogenase [Clostridium beijerinckii]NOW30139.1 shikimate dehydrogenase [Clostridium beijerinckii]
MEFYGLIGEKLSHSLSPKIHNTLFKDLKVEGAYKLFEVEKENLGKLIESIKLLKIKGVNVTIPYKQDVMEYLDFISDEAKKIGAVNTIYLKDNKLYGYNTDYYGFGTILNNNEIVIRDNVAMVLGNGGAAKAVITYLLDHGIKKIYLVSRKIKENSVDKDERIEFKTYEEISEIKGDILINTTPLGMYPKVYDTPVNEDIINNFNSLIDIIYNPRETRFLKIGKNSNKKVCGGIEMLVGQAIKAEEIWQGCQLDNELTQGLYSIFENEFK